MYRLFNFKYQISHRCVISKKSKFRISNVFNHSIARFTIRFYVISQINTCIEFRFVRFCNFRIDAWFHHVEKICSKVSNNASLRKFQKFATMTIIRFNKSKIYRVEKVCAKISNNASLKKHARKFQNSSLKKLKFASSRKFARKFQTSWYLFWTENANKKQKRMLWKNVEKYNFRNDKCAKINWYNLTKKKLVRFY